MKKNILSKMGMATLALALSFGVASCATHEDGTNGSEAPQANTKALEGSSPTPSSSTSTESATKPLNDDTNTDASSSSASVDTDFKTNTKQDKSMSKTQLEYIRGAAQYIGDWVTGSYKKGSYPATISFGEDPSITYGVEQDSSGPDSLCIFVKSVEYNPSLNTGAVVYYDTQTKKVVPEGKSCKAPLGETFSEGAGE